MGQSHCTHRFFSPLTHTNCSRTPYICAKMSLDVPAAARTQSPYLYLYTSVATTHLGEVAAVLVALLVLYGRSTAKDLQTRTGLPLRLVKSALVLMVQLNCVFYWKDDISGLVHYSFNENGLLVFLHSGDIIHHLKEKYGADAAEMAQNVVQNGHVKVADYLGTEADDEARYEKLRLLVKLVSAGWLCPLRQVDYSPVDDVWNKLYEETLKNTPRNAITSEVKRVAEAREKTKVKLEALYEAGTTAGDIYTTENGIQTVKASVVLRLNLARFEKHLRTSALASLARLRVGVLSAKLYEIALELVEQHSPDMRYPFLQISGLINDPEEARFFVNSIENSLVDNKKTVFNVRDLLQYIPECVDLRNSILHHNFLKPNPRKRGAESPGGPVPKKVKTEILEEPVEVVEEDDQDNFDESFTDNSEPHSLALVQHHMKLLSNSTAIPFLVEVSPGSYTVPYTSLLKDLKQYNYETLVKTTLGPNAFRVLKCLKALKLADEKTLSNSILLKERTVRNELYRLIGLNIVEIQEVPRSADRAASKTFYLFRHKDGTAYNHLRHLVVFSMAEILTNIASFKQDHKILLEKCEREDVKGHEDELLLDLELKVLKDLQAREIHNMGRFMRMKTLMGIFGTF